MATPHLNCPRCGLSLPTRAGHPADTVCPRCKGQAGVDVPMYETARPRPPVVSLEPQAA